MAGIYLHIPFCKQACHYCNFHFSTSLRLKDDMVTAIIKEVDHRHHFLAQKELESIYFGGGTPSLLSYDDICRILEKIGEHFKWSPEAEITLEANPDDLTIQTLSAFKQAGINRLSIGIQSFHEEDLTYMNRAHNSKEAERCIDNARDVGFDRISADLIYGSPTTSENQWLRNVEKMIAYDLPHISTYALTVEEGTALHHFIASGKRSPIDENLAARQFELLVPLLENAGYIHYEISNFAKPGHFAVHNSNYWKGKPYLGLGPGAHSFDGNSIRSWNIAHNPKYIDGITSGNLAQEEEKLSSLDMFNEYLLIRLRTIWGIDTEDIMTHFPQYADTLWPKIDQWKSRGYLQNNEGIYTLTSDGKLLADKISMDLFAES